MFLERVESATHAVGESEECPPEGSPDIAALFQQHQDALLRYCRARSRNGAEADDVLQEVFCNLASKPHLRINGRPRAYLFRMARNLMLNRHQAEQARRADAHVHLDMVEEAALASPTPSVEVVVQLRQDIATVMKALEELPPKCQAVFVRKRFLGRSYKEIAEELDISSVVGVKKYMMRALGHLRDNVDIDEFQADGASQAAE